ncbi:MAG: hypothetical protein PHS54_05140 [Clostridia bacterium]|nr:hypothetical protein [Clostridia bacterium]
MQFEKFNVSKPREEQGKNGEVKTFWDNVGTVTIFTKEDGSKSGIVELLSFNQRTLKLNLFQRKQEGNYAKQSPKNDYSQPAPEDDYSQPDQDEEIKVENIPF